MVQTFNNFADLFNEIVKVNSSWIKITDEKMKKLPISCKYFLTIFDLHNDLDVKNMFCFIEDETREMKYPFEKKSNIDYSMMLEIEQFYNIDLNDMSMSLKKLSKNIDYFINIVKESNGKIVFVLDINYLINLTNKKKDLSNNLSNYIIDLIISKLNKSDIPEISEIFILDKNNLITNKTNILYSQFNMCLKNKSDYLNKICDKELAIFKYINEPIYDRIDLENNEDNGDNEDKSVYWKLVNSNNKITEHLDRIQSPYDNTYFNVMIINSKPSYVKKTNIIELLNTNIFELKKNSSITIDPIQRLFI